MEDRFSVRKQAACSATGAHEVFACARTSTQIQVPGKEVDRVVAGTVEPLSRFGDPQMQLSPTLPEQAFVRGVLDQCVVEGHLAVTLVDETAGHELLELDLDVASVVHLTQE